MFSFTAVYNWRGDTRYGLPLEIGETVQILEECAGTLSDYMLSLIFFSFEADRYTNRARGKFRIRFKVKGNDEFTGKRDDVAS